MRIDGFLIWFLAAGSLAWIAWQLVGWLIDALRGSEKTLLEFSSPGIAQPSQLEVRMGSQAYQLRLAFAGLGLDVTGWEHAARFLAWGLVAFALILPMILADFPALLWLVAPILAWLIVNGFVQSRWEGQRNQMEKEIPLLLTRMSGSLQTSPSVIEALNEEAENLEPGGPLQTWTFRLVQRMQARGLAGLAEAQEEAAEISPALLLVVVEIERLVETGGQGYARAFRLTAENLAGVLETRAQAFATAEGAWGTVRLIALALGGAVVSILMNRTTGQGDSPLVQLAVLLGIAWAGVGWWYIGDVIRQATQ